MFVITIYPIWPSLEWLRNRIHRLKEKPNKLGFADRGERNKWLIDQEMRHARYQLAQYKMM